MIKDLCQPLKNLKFIFKNLDIVYLLVLIHHIINEI